jgi:hypothetical protein
MFMDLWVASDGITTVRFSDQQSALIYCAETDWPTDALTIVRHQLHVGANGGLQVQLWQPAMHPELGTGQWLDHGVWLPDLSDEALATLDPSVLNPQPYNLQKYIDQAGRNGTSIRDEAILLENN